jgi:hypothetical protein
MEVIVKTAKRQMPKVAGGSLALPRQFVIHLSSEDYAIAHIDIGAMREEVGFRLVKFAEQNGSLKKPWVPALEFVESAEVTTGWPLARASYNRVDALRARTPSAPKSNDDDRLRRQVRNHYSGPHPSVFRIAIPSESSARTDTRHAEDTQSDLPDSDDETRYTGQLTEYLDHDDLGPLYERLPTSLVPLDPEHPKIELNEATLIGRATVGGSAEVSRRHCLIEPVKSGWMLTDKWSTNGTLVNDLPVRGTKPLFDSDKIQFGSGGPVYLFNRSRPEPYRPPQRGSSDFSGV